MIEKLFDDLLGGLDQHGRDEFGLDWTEAVLSSLEGLREAYECLTVNGRVPIDYSTLPTQAAYVFTYAIGRAEFTYQLLKRYRVSLGEPIFPNPEVRITSLGGGPGSEIAGVVKYILDPESGENVNSIEYWVLDKNAEWENLCQSIVDDLSAFLPVKLVYAPLDLWDPMLAANIP